MNSPIYFNYIEDKISHLVTRVELRGNLNILDLNIHCENFYRDLFNNLYKWDLSNLNKVKQNVKAIDLISNKKKIIIQVSATCTKQKIESALKNITIKNPEKYSFKFISISKNAKLLRKKIYINPQNVVFSPVDDIYDASTILKDIKDFQTDKLKDIYDFFKKELGREEDTIKLDSNLAIVVDILSKEKLDEGNNSITVEDSFEIDRKISFNDLNASSLIINDYSVHYNRLDKIYSEFDLSGVNKSKSVLDAIRMKYVKNLKLKKDDELFLLILDNVKKTIIQSTNFKKMAVDMLDLCVNIIVVDAFIRCKIFKNPNNYKHVATR